MKSKTGYIVFRDGKVWIADSPKPQNDGSSPYYDRNIYFEDMDSHELYIKQWLNSQIEAVNVTWFNGEQLIWFASGKPESLTITLERLSNGQKCLFVPEGDKVRVVKLI